MSDEGLETRTPSKTFRVWLYGMYGYNDMPFEECDNLEDAIDAVRRLWPYPSKIIMPNGDSYDFTKDGDEWLRPVIYQFMVLMDTEALTPPQIVMLKDINKDPDLKQFMYMLKNKPHSYDTLTEDDEESIRVKKAQALLKLIHCGLIEFVPFRDGSGIQDERWR